VPALCPAGRASGSAGPHQRPEALPVIDGLLAASAKVRGWTLVTRNTADAARSGAHLVGPFEPMPASEAGQPM
jgi:predicted nucleic acid-binding protein